MLLFCIAIVCSVKLPITADNYLEFIFLCLIIAPIILIMYFICVILSNKNVRNELMKLWRK